MSIGYTALICNIIHNVTSKSIITVVIKILNCY